MLFTKSVERRRRRTSGTTIEVMRRAGGRTGKRLLQGHIVRSGLIPLQFVGD